MRPADTSPNIVTMPSLAARKRNARLAAGLCGACGKRAPEEGRTACRPCLDIHREDGRRLTQRRSLQQLCLNCC